MDDGFRLQIGTYQHRLEHLLRDGLDIQCSLEADPECPADLEVMRAWQRECAATISQRFKGFERF